MILISTSNLNFNNVTVGEDNTKSFTIFNDNIFSVTVTISSGISQYVVIPTSELISANGHLIVEVKFTPTDALSYNSSVTITNSYDASVDSVSLTGQGIKPVIAVNPASLSFGTIATNDSTQQIVMIQNTNALATLKVTNVVSSNAAFTFFPTTFEILPSSQAQLTVVFSSAIAAVNTGILTLTNNSSNAPSKQIALTGTTIAPTASLSVSSLDFGNVTLNDIKTMNVTLTNISTDEILLLSQSIQFTNLVFSTTISSIRLAKSESLIIPVKFSPTNTATQNGVLNLQTNAGLLAISLTGKGIVSSNIYLPATTIDIGNTIIGETLSKNLTIINNGQLDLIISAISSDNPRFTYNPSTATVIAGSRTDIAITFVPTDATAQTGQLTIASNDPDTPNIYVNLKGQGITPVINVPTLLTFADTTVNETKSSNLEIGNTGNCLLTITNLVFDNPVFSTAQPVPLYINQKSSKSVSVEFTPIAVGFSSCNLTIQSNDFVNPSKIIILKGNGVTPHIVVTPTDVDFGYVNVSIPQTRQINIFNNGAGQLIISNIISSDSQFVPDVTSLTINAGTSEILTLTLTASSVGNKLATITLVNNDPSSPNVLINARGIAESPVISVDASPIVFSTVALNEERTKTLTILNNSHVILNVSAAMNTLTPAELHISASSFSVAPGGSNTLTVTFKPTAIATYTGTLELSSNDIVTPLISISVSGVGATIARILVTQESIYFPPTPIGSISHESLEVKNIGSADLIVSATAKSTDTYINEFFIDNTAQITILPNQSHFYSVTLKPTTAGSKTGIVEVEAHNDPNVVDPIEVGLSGQGINAVLKWQAFSLDNLVSEDLKQAAAALSGLMSGIITTLNFINELLSTLKTFIVDFSDPLVMIITGIQSLIVNLLNDFAATGLYYLQILPTDPRINPNTYPQIFKGITWNTQFEDLFDFEGTDVFNSVRGGSKAFFNKITLSFDDAADARRPKFGSTAKAGCIVIAMDADDIFKMIDLIVKLTKVLQIEFKAKFNPPTNLAAIAGNKKVKLTFTGAGGLLPNAFLIFRSETAGGELIADTAFLADGTKKIVYRTDNYGRLVKRYKLVGVTTMVEQLMRIFNISEGEAKNMFSTALYNIKGLMANLDRAISLKFSYDDENLENDKTYSYVIVSASIDDTVDKSRILLGMKYSDELYTTYGINSDDNPEMWVYDVTQKVYPALLSDAAIIRDDPTDPDSIGPTYIFGAGEFSTEISVTPKSIFSANITGINRCRNYRCRFETEITETIIFTAEDFQAANFVRKLEHNPLVSTVTVKNKSRDNKIIAKSEYAIQNGNTLIFNDAVSQVDEELLVTYSYYIYILTKNITGETKKQTISAVNENVMTIILDNKTLVKDSLVITATKFSTIEEPLKITILDVNELDGTAALLIDEEITQTYTVTLICSYSYYLAPEAAFQCVNSEFNSYYFDVEACDNGTTLCPGFENRSCFYNSGLACTNTGISTRHVLQVYSTDIEANTTGGANIVPENIPYKNFYDPIYCQLGITAQRCDGYSQTEPRAGYKGTPPDWQSLSLGDLFPGIYALIKMIDDFLKSLLASLQGMTQAILDFITLIQMKITELTDFLSRIKTYLDILAFDFKGSGFYLLNVLPQAGGNEFLKQAIVNATNGPSSDESGYTAGVVIAYGGDSADAIAAALKTIFG